MTQDVAAGEAPWGQDARTGADARFERHRAELTGYCYRMLGAPAEAEDAVQETLLRAWRSRDRYDERRSSWRSWLFTIATNVCLDMLGGAQRRARAMDLGPSSVGPPDLGSPLSADRWVLPIADHRVLGDAADPADIAAQRETIQLAFVAALQHLPPKQRAVLILRDVLRCRADEVAALLEATVPSVNSALQRARATLALHRPRPTDPLRPMDALQADLLRRYVDAFEQHDIDTLVSLLHEDATMSMPPLPWWMRGRREIERLFLAGDGCRGDRLLPTAANGCPAFGQYRLRGGAGGHDPFALVVVGLSGDRIVETTAYLETASLFPLFGLPLHLPADPTVEGRDSP